MIRAAWLGHWKPPWGVDRGRRWGDPIWALAAISQACLLGGREGRWPRLNQEARRAPLGPRVLQVPEVWEARPDPAWVARLRHGSAAAPPARRGPQESELLAWAWEEATRAFQRRLLLDTLQACGYRITEAAETLGLARPALYATAKRLGVDLIAERLQRSD